MWSEYTGSAVEWDQIVASFDNAHPTHQYHWTIPDQKKSATCHLLYLPRNSNRPTAAIQLLHKQHVLGLHYFRADGGLAGDHSALTDLPNWVQASARHRPWYLRVFSRAVLVPNDVLQFKSAGFTPVETKIHTGISAMITLSTPYSGTYSGNWKHNLARAQKRGLVISHKEAPTLDQLMSIYRELEKVKNISTQFGETELRHLMSSFGSNLIIANIKSSSGELLSVRAALLLGTKAFDLLAATSEAGRAHYASNLAFHALLAKCADLGVTFYDCAGIDPANGKGVMHFKMGAGGQAFDYGGEWELGSAKYIRASVNGLMKLKLALKKHC